MELACTLEIIEHNPAVFSAKVAFGRVENKVRHHKALDWERALEFNGKHNDPSKIFDDRLELCGNRGDPRASQGIIEAMVDMVLNQRAFGLLYRLLDGMQLLRDIGAGLCVRNHLDDA